MDADRKALLEGRRLRLAWLHGITPDQGMLDVLVNLTDREAAAWLRLQRDCRQRQAATSPERNGTH